MHQGVPLARLALAWHLQRQAPELRVTEFESSIADRSVPKRTALLLESYKGDRLLSSTSPAAKNPRPYILRALPPPQEQARPRRPAAEWVPVLPF